MTASPERIGAIDLLRGLALAGMVVFHAAWDLHAFGLTRIDPVGSFGWWLFGRTIAATFLALSGVALVLARHRGARWPEALRRIGVIAAAAGAVTLATALAAPGQAVWFGILHCIALCNLLALPLLKVDRWAVLALAAGALALPWLAPRLLPDGFWWTGLTANVPDTLDYQPLFPSLGYVALGIWFGRSGRVEGWLSAPTSRLPGATLLRAAGRRSLLVYLVHQPVLYGILLCATAMTAPERRAEPFLAECRRSCIVRTADAGVCEAACRCVAERFGGTGAGLTEADQTVAVQACTATPP